MYRKLLLMASFFLATMTMVAQEVEQETPDTLGIHPFVTEEVCKPEITNWSIYIDGGFSHFDGDNGVKLKTADQMSFDGGIGLNYQFTPLWCWYLDWHTTTYGQHMFDRDMDYDELIQNSGKSLGHLHTIGTGIGLNLMSAFFPKREHSLFNLYVLVGGGYGLYSYRGSGCNYTFDNKGEVKTMTQVYDAYTNGKGQWIKEGDDNFNKWNGVGFLTGGFLAEFNVSRVFSLGVRAYYDYFMNDYTDGGTSIQNKNNKNNDGIFACDLEMRFNILAKSKSHMRNIGSLNNFDSMIAAQNGNDALNTNAGAYAGHEKDTLVISSRDTIVSISKSVQKYKEDDKHFYVYFDNDKANLDDRALATIQQVAALLNRDTTLCAEISGYCDNTGNVEYNKKLSARRANNVLEEFVEEYEFNGDRAYTVSKGIIVGKRSKAAFGPNRRVDIHIVSKDKFAEMKAAHEAELRAEEAANGNTVKEESKQEAAPVAEEHTQEAAVEAQKPAAKADVETNNVAEDEKNDLIKPGQKMVTIREGETLSKLARREYGNTHCWIYIYEANAVRISNPSAVRPGMVLFLPTLSEEQVSITKEQADARYARRK